MSKTPARKKPRITLQVEVEDKATIVAAVARWKWTTEADILRTALRVGLRALAQDPAPLGTPPVPMEDMSDSPSAAMTTGTFERAISAAPAPPAKPAPKEDTPPATRAALIEFAMGPEPKAPKGRKRS